MKWIDALRIAATKFRTRIVRNILVACSLAIGIIMIVALFSGTNGVLQFGKALLVDSLQGKYFAAEMIIPEYPENDPTALPRSVEFHADQYFQQQKNAHGVLALYTQKYTVPTTKGHGVDAIPVEKQQTPFSAALNTADQIFIEDMIDAQFAWDKEINDGIPAIVPMEMMLSAEKDLNSRRPKERFELNQKVRQDYLGKQVKLTSILLDPNTGKSSNETVLDLTLTIVGFSTEGIFYSSATNPRSIVLPKWAEEHEVLKKELAQAEWRVISQFPDKKSRDEYVKKSYEKISELGMSATSSQPEAPENAAIPSGDLSPYVMPVEGRFEVFVETVEIFRNVMFGIAGFLLAIAGIMLMTTIGKIVADSRKEIGVYRAIGAQGFDIQKIFYSYVFVLVSLAATIGIVIGLLVDVGVSLKWGDRMFYLLAQFGTTVNIEKPAFIFLSITPLHLLIIFAGALVLGIAASIIPIFRASRIDPIVALREE